MEKRTTKNELVLGSGGRCFICSHRRNPSSSYPVYSLQSLSRYLKLDMRKVFHEKDSAPPGLLATVQKSNLKVELCGDCSSLTEKFSRLHTKLEKAELEVASQLQHILSKLEESDKADVDVGDLKIEPIDIGQLEIVQVLKKETKLKCSERVHNLFPRLPVQSLTPDQVDEKRRKLKSDPNRVTPSPVSEADIETEQDLKLESITYDIEENGDGGDSNLDPSSPEDDDDNLLDDPQVLLHATSLRSTAPTTSTGKSGGLMLSHCRIDDNTGRHQCKDCSKDFTGFMGFYLHYRAQHLNIRYNCSACGLSFGQASNLNTHQRKQHQGVKFKCSLCNKLFPLESQLTQHQRRKLACNQGKMPEKTKKVSESNKASDAALAIIRPSSSTSAPADYKPEIGGERTATGNYRCTSCSLDFSTRQGLQRHHQVKHLKVRYKCKLCDKQFTFKQVYERHYQSLHLRMRYRCRKCSKVFSQKMTLSRHLRLADCLQIVKHDCHICKREFSSATGLTNHLRSSEHVTDADRASLEGYKCQECGFVLSSRAFLERHLRMTHRIQEGSGNIMGSERRQAEEDGGCP